MAATGGYQQDEQYSYGSRGRPLGSPGSGQKSRSSDRGSSKESKSSVSSDGFESPEPSPRQDTFEAFCGACCTSRPKGLKVKRLKALEYATLLETMDVDDGDEDACACLSPFLARFPYMLHPLVRPIFFSLGQGGEVSENKVEWTFFVENLSRITHGRHGATWSDLLEAFESCEMESTVQSAVLNAASLCFYLGHPYLAYSADDVLTGLTPTAGVDAGVWSCNNSWIKTPRGSVLESSGSDFCASERMAIDGLVAALQEPTDPTEGTVVRQRSTTAADVCDCACRESALRWLSASVPCLPLTVGPQIANTLMGIPLRREFPVVDSGILDAGLSFLLRGTSAELWESETWTSLFDDRRDGRSFSGLLHSLLHYKGPVAMVIKTERGEVLGAVSKYWTDGNGDFGGGPDCYLFALAPTLVVCRACGTSSYAYINQRNRQKVRGLGFGGKVDWFRFFINDSLDSGYVLQGDLTYQRATLLPGAEFQATFKVAHIELWGCGTTGSKVDQSAQKKRFQRMSERNRMVDKSKIVRSRTDADVFLPNTFKGTKDAREVTGVIERRATTGDQRASA